MWENSMLRLAVRRVGAEARMMLRGLKPRQAPKSLSTSRDDAASEPVTIAVSDALPGWLLPQAARVSYRLMHEIPAGPAVEIGVFRGKYLAVIRGAMGRSSRIVGYDLFTRAQAPLVERDLQEGFGDGEVALYRMDSTRLTPERVLSDCGAAPVFISVDGSHDGDPVLSDMRLCDKVLHPKGIVAMDDFLNPLALGVNEAVGRFMTQKQGDLVPFLYVSNKLFMCRAAAFDEMRAVALEILNARLIDPLFDYFARTSAAGEDLDREFYGYKVLIGSP
ncbi:class I SAM-dependent methyltransferase [Octadecabacter sp. 1_MG-2023]|uniref:class I SAM-dependent methyltransferase n=1 Tax=unclassified Octadecabacter TaxID=196158 RepID=UPI001C08203E|nr:MULTISPECIES: class I SAM-dependent methyltransferase [unclassified Octadecabacter]MBU2993521.1 class I SAM-dependent methyltransferase [Octadecabacter sp. B2R22]MDO6735636.1 class I SAM-dependent methyltransferase [Octadecabacter sp. 1_MG-2023]